MGSCQRLRFGFSARHGNAVISGLSKVEMSGTFKFPSGIALSKETGRQIVITAKPWRPQRGAKASMNRLAERASRDEASRRTHADDFEEASDDLGAVLRA